MKIIFVLIIFNILSLVFAEEVLVTVHPDYPPVSYFDEKDKKIKGVAVDLVEAALKNMNVKYRLVNTGTWGRAQEEVKLGRVDMLLPPYKTSEREEWIYFQEKPILMDETAVFVAKGNEFKYQKFSDLVNRRGVAIINDSFGDEFDRFDRDKLKMKRLATTEQCFKFILKNRGDFVIAGLHAGKRVLKDLGLMDQVSILNERVIVTGMYAGISKKSKFFSEDKRKEFERQLKDLVEKNAQKEFEKKY